MPDTFVFNDVGPVALANLQCNTLRSTGHARSTQVFRRFPEATAFKAWLKEKAPQPSSSDAEGATLVNLLFTKEGLARLGVGEDTLARMDPAFRRGPRDIATLDKLGDGVTAGWGPHKAPWHVVELHAHDGNVVPNIDTHSECVVEYGSGIDKDGQRISERNRPSYGHLRILDGISKLVYTQADYDELIRANRGKVPTKWDPRHQLSTLLVRDLLTDISESFGSYFVFRKLHQDVAKLNLRISAIMEEIENRRKKNTSDELGTLTPELRGFDAFKGKSGAALREQVTQWIFGRGTEGMTGFDKDDNDFNYDDDRGGRQCPLHAHTRKVNPRGRTGDLEGERKRAIARRGTSGYKTQVFKPGLSAAQESEQTALLFWCAQSSIGEQFEYIQEKWANSANVDLDLLPTPDVDTLIGRLHPKHEQLAPGASHWERWKTTSDIAYDVWDHIQLVGAEYLYAPSLAGIAALKAL